MHRPAARLALFAFILVAPVSRDARAMDDSPQSVTVLGAPNQQLASGSAALEAGRYQDGIRLSLAGLEDVASTRDQAAGHANVCAGYAALKRWTDALPHCNRSLDLDRGNWRAFNNRAAVYVGLGMLDLALTDVNAGLALAPGSSILRKSLEVVKEHRAAEKRDRRRRPVRA
jgi:tetratricopeptide (TPR) repeat protein